MQVDYFLVLQGEPDARDLPPDAMASHRALGWFRAELADIARAAGVRPLDDFISLSREELVINMGEEMVEMLEAEGIGDDPLTTEPIWFEATDGLRTVHALLAHLRGTPHTLDEAQPGPRHQELVTTLLESLDTLARELAGAEAEKRAFRLAAL